MKNILQALVRLQNGSLFKLILQYPNDPLLDMLMDDLYEKVKSEAANVQYERGAVVEMNTTPRYVRSIVYRIAAVAIFTGIIIGLAVYFLNSKEDYKSKLAGNIRQTAKAQQDFILLPDSTQIWINASTDLRYPKKFDTDKREIYLEGEAFLDVKHAEDVPFVIHLPGRISVTVLGTAFNIKAFPDRNQAIITVQRGKVRVSKGNKVLSTLTVGQEIRVSINNDLSVVRNVAIDQISTWQNGNLYFNDMLLKDVVKDISQQKNIDIEIENEKLANTVIKTGFKKDESIKEILSIIKVLTDCSIKEENGVFILF